MAKNKEALDKAATPAPPKKRAYKEYVAKPNKQGVVVIPHNFIPTEDMDEKTGLWKGVVPA